MKRTVKQQKRLQTKNGILSKKVGTTPFKAGDVLVVKIHALSPNQLGLSQLANGYTIVVPKVSLADEVRVSIQTVSSGQPKFATAKVLEILNKSQIALGNNSQNKQTENQKQSVRAGDILNVQISKTGPKGSGLAEISPDYAVVVPNSKVGDQVKIQLVRVKQDYAFGKIVEPNSLANRSKSSVAQMSLKYTSMKSEDLSSALMQNSKFHLVLPKTARISRGYAIVKLNGFIVFIKMALGAKLGQTVRIQTMKVGSDYAVAKILEVCPLSKAEKLMRTKRRVQQMIQTGMHFGERAIGCHANMRKYVWYRKKGQNQNRPFLKKDRYYINLLRTRRCLRRALKQLAKYAAKGKTFLFVGTKKSASALIARTALFTKTSFFVNTRWLGGMLTNWKTILKSISQIKPILKEKQRIIQNILEKRQKIKYRFIKKVNLLRKRGQKLMAKGKILIAKLKQNKNLLIERSQQLIKNKEQILSKNQVFIQKYIELKSKKAQLLQQSQILAQKGHMLVYQKQNLLKQFKDNQARLQEFKQLFLIGQELLKVKKEAKQKGQQILSVSYGKLQDFSELNKFMAYAVPNPPKEILNRMIQSMKMKYETKLSQNAGFDQNFAKAVQSVGQNKNHCALHSSANQKTSNAVVLSKLLNKFTAFLPFMKVYIENLLLRHQNLQILLQNIQKNIELIQSQFQTLKEFNQKISTQLVKLKTKLLAQQKTLKTLRAKLKRLASEQRLLKFLPKLRYLPTPKTKMAETVQTLMKKFVDPKMTIPMEQIYDDRFKFTSKKIAAARKQKWQRLEKYFGGITKMAKMSKKQISNNVAIIVGQQEEMNAVRECQKLGIKMFTLVDTNCNPKFSDHIIPVNDDSRNSVKFVLEQMLTHIRLAQKLRQKVYFRKVQK
nr:ribosomal protein S2 [Follicularia botryoides]